MFFSIFNAQTGSGDYWNMYVASGKSPNDLGNYDMCQSLPTSKSCAAIINRKCCYYQRTSEPSSMHAMVVLQLSPVFRHYCVQEVKGGSVTVLQKNSCFTAGVEYIIMNRRVLECSIF